MNYKTMLAKVLGEKELMEMNVQTIKDDESLFNKLVDKNFLLLVDWSGEDRQGMLYRFSTTDCNQCWEYNWLFPKMKSIKNIIKK